MILFSSQERSIELDMVLLGVMNHLPSPKGRDQVWLERGLRGVFDELSNGTKSLTKKLHSLQHLKFNHSQKTTAPLSPPWEGGDFSKEITPLIETHSRISFLY